MKKLLLIILFILLIPLKTNALTEPNLYSKKYMVYDLTEDKVLISKGNEEVSKIASLTKMMTVLVAVENTKDIKSEIIVTQEMLNGIPWDAAVMGLEVGTKITLEDMLYAAMLPSAADATHVIAHYVAGSTENFVNMMNNKAILLGMNDTRFENVIGMDHENHYSSINDLIKLLKYALRNNEFKKVYTKKGHMMLNGVTVRSTIHAGGAWIGLNTDRILGGKTGYTDEAGTCISVLFKSNGHDMLLITLRAPFVKNQNYHIKDALALIDYTDINFGDQVIVEKDTLIDKIKVKLSTTDNYNIKSTTDITKYLSNDYDKSKISYEYTGATEILYNFKKGDELGKISYYYDGELVTNEFVVLTEELKPDIVEIFDTYKTQILILAFSSVFGIITILILLRKSLA